MTEITVNIDDYLDEAQKRSIVAEAFRNAAAQHAIKDFERIISNSAYYLVGDIVDQHFEGRMVEVLKSKTIDVINKLSSTTVFSPPNAWDREASKGWQQMQKAIEDLKPMIHQRVSDIIADYDHSALRDLIETQVGEAIIKKLQA